MAKRVSKIPGIGRDAERVLLEAINALTDDVERLGKVPRTTGLQRAGYVATEGETVRMRGGERLTLPRARVENQGAQVQVILETEGRLEVVVHQGLIDGLEIEELESIGLYTFQSNGSTGWFCNNAELRARYIVGDPGTEDGGIVIQGSTFESLLKVSDLGGSNEAMFIVHRHSTSLGPVIVTSRSNSDDETHAIVTSGQDVGTWYGVAWDGVDYAYAAAISMFVDGTPGSNDMPGRLAFFTVPDAGSALTERFRISSFGGWGIGGANYGTAGQVFRSAGGAAPPTWGLAGASGIDLTDDYSWTGQHTFNSVVRLASDETVSTTGTITDLALGATTNRLRMGGGAGDRLLVSMDPGPSPDGRVVIIQNVDGTSTDDLEVQHDDGASGTDIMRFLCADQVNARIGSRGMGIAVYDTTSDRWYLTAFSREATRLIATHAATAADASYSVTVPAGATWFKVFAKAGGSGGGGADSDTNLEVTAGGGGGEGCEAELWFPVSSGAITGAVGVGGTAGSNAGGNGGVGGGTTVIYAGATYTLNQGGIGIGTAAGIVGAGGSATLGGSGGGGALTAGADVSIYSRFTTGANGDPGIMLGAAAITAEAAIGGNGAGQGGGRGGQVVAAAGASNGANAASQGCGGGGGARLATGAATGATGGTGSPGYVRIEFFSGPVPTFAAIT